MSRSLLVSGVLALLLPAGATAAHQPDPGRERDREPAPVFIMARTPPSTQARLVEGTMILPRYPRAARRARIQGLVHLSGVIDEKGRVQDLRSTDDRNDPAGFRRATITAIASWNYRPATLADGTPVSVPVLFEVRFLPD
ncbi:MAG: TonB family protein [Acidobacteriota bacterium]